MADTPPAEFRERLRAEVERLQGQGMTKKEIAARAGISRSVLDRYERGGMPENPSRLEALAKAFGCSMDYLWARASERHGVYTRAPDVVDELVRRLEAIAAEFRLATAPAADEAGLLPDELFRDDEPGTAQEHDAR